MAYSMDFRHRVFKIKEEKNLTFEKTSERFGVNIRTLFRWQRDIDYKKTRNKPATRIDMDKLRKDVDNYPDAYLCERAERFKVSITGMFYALKRLNITYKKNPGSSTV